MKHSLNSYHRWFLWALKTWFYGAQIQQLKDSFFFFFLGRVNRVVLGKNTLCSGKRNMIYGIYKLFTTQGNSWCVLLDIVDPWKFYCDPISNIKLNSKPMWKGSEAGRKISKINIVVINFILCWRTRMSFPSVLLF